MPFDTDQISDDLRGLIAGEVLCDELHVQMYASDASIYEIRPLGVVRPRSTEDVVQLVQYAAENQIPLHARGAGTGLAGESLGPGLVVDFAHHLRRIHSLADDTVRVQPGVVLSRLNRFLRPARRMFGPDPATTQVTTMGSVLAMDGSGSHWLRYGSARRHVVSMEVVLADGSIIEAGEHDLKKVSGLGATNGSNGANGSTHASEHAALLETLAEVLARNRTLIETHQPKSLVNRSGYHLDNVLNGTTVSLPQLLVGSEGTLGLITAATLRTVPMPGHAGVVLLFFDRLEGAAKAALEIPHLGASACDLLDRRLLSIARETDRRFEEIIPEAAEAVLLVEQQGADRAEVRDRLMQVVSLVRRRLNLAFDSRTALEEDDVELFWSLAQKVVPRLYRLRGTQRPLPFVESIAVPPETLPDFLVRLQNCLKKHQVTASLFAHAGHGQLHLRPFLDLSVPEDVAKIEPLATDLYHEVMQVRGTIGGEHGDGLSRTWFVRELYGPLYEVFREVKQLFDPQNIFNPGKIVATVPPRMTANLRPAVRSQPMEARRPPLPILTDDEEAVHDDDTPVREASPPPMGQLVQLQLSWQPDEMMHAARSCNGCGACRAQSPDVRMCPMFRHLPAEEASPRSKANLVRGLLSGDLAASELGGEALKTIADLCVNCHQCRLECPAAVDIPKLMIETKAQFVATNGLRGSDALAARLDTLLTWGNLLAPITNWALGNRALRWVAERMFGIAQGRKLPRFAGRTFLQHAERKRLTHPPKAGGSKVLYFVDLYANWFDPLLGEAVAKVLEHNHVAVFVDPDQRRSGMELITAGATDLARELAVENVRILADAVRQGFDIVTSEPSAALCLKHEYVHLLGTDDARLVASRTQDITHYLWDMHQRGRLELDFKPLTARIGYHLPCHLRALGGESPGEDLLRLVRGLSVRRIEKGCSGMAGMFGLKPENYRASLRIGWGLISEMRDPSVEVGSTECSACKMQMEQGTNKPTIHPLKLLALAYGLMPEFASLLTARGEDLTVT